MSFLEFGLPSPPWMAYSFGSNDMRTIATLLFLFAVGLLKAAPQPKTGAQDASRIYRKAYIDVEDEGHLTKQGRNNSDATSMAGFIWVALHDLGVGIALSDEDKKNPDLHVICRFKHGFGKPMITPGFQIKVTYIERCTLKIIDKKSQKTLLDKTYLRNNDRVSDFIKQAFVEWHKKLNKQTP